MKAFQRKNNLKSNLYYRIKRHIEHNVIKKNYDQSEKLFEQIPANLKDQIIRITHGDIINSLNFFKEKDKEFVTGFMYELKQINIGIGEFIYSQNDEA